MRTAFVIGFFDTVKSELLQQFANEFERGAIVWIGLDRVNPKKGFNFNTFHDLFRRSVTDGTEDELLLVLGDTVPWLTAAIEQVIATVTGRTVHVQKFRDLRTAEPIVQRVRDFQPAVPEQRVSELMLASFLGGQKMLCVRGSHQPGYDVALSRESFEEVCFANHCDELVVDVEKNSNLVRELKRAASRFGCVLYAWHGLRTAPPDVKAKYQKGRFFEDSTTSRVVRLLARTLKVQPN